VWGQRSRTFNGSLYEIGGICELHEEDEKCMGNNILPTDLEATDHLEDEEGVRIILKFIL
jgi:hypothetical protein